MITPAINTTGCDYLVEHQDIPRKFNETLTDWAIRCQVLRRYQAVPAVPSPHAVDGEML